MDDQKNYNEMIIERLDRMEKSMVKLNESVDKRINGLIELQKKLVHTAIGAPIPPPSKSTELIHKKSNSSSLSGGSKMVISLVGDNTLEVSGKTFDNKNLIIQCGGKFNGDTKTWNVPLVAYEQLKETFVKNKLEVGKGFVVDNHKKIEDALKKLQESAYVDNYEVEESVYDDNVSFRN